MPLLRDVKMLTHSTPISSALSGDVRPWLRRDKRDWEEMAELDAWKQDKGQRYVHKNIRF